MEIKKSNDSQEDVPRVNRQINIWHNKNYFSTDATFQHCKIMVKRVYHLDKTSRCMKCFNTVVTDLSKDLHYKKDYTTGKIP